MTPFGKLTKDTPRDTRIKEYFIYEYVKDFLHDVSNIQHLDRVLQFFLQ